MRYVEQLVLKDKTLSKLKTNNLRIGIYNVLKRRIKINLLLAI